MGDPDQWRTSIMQCDCCCCLACFLPFAFFGYNVHLLQTVSDSQSLPQCPKCPDIVPVCAGFLYFTGLAVGGACGNTVTPGLGLLSCFSVALHAYVRNTIRVFPRDMDNSPCCRNPCGDCCMAIICYSCAMAQEQRELIYERDEVGPPKFQSRMDMPDIQNTEYRHR